jgi:hypothetical protein
MGPVDKISVQVDPHSLMGHKRLFVVFVMASFPGGAISYVQFE